MTNRGNTATAWYILSIIRSSVGYVFFFLLYLCLFSMHSQILSVWLASLKTLPVWNMQKQRARKISWAMQLVLALRAYMVIIISKFKFPVINSISPFFSPCGKVFQRSEMNLTNILCLLQPNKKKEVATSVVYCETNEYVHFSICGISFQIIMQRQIHWLPKTVGL